MAATKKTGTVGAGEAAACQAANVVRLPVKSTRAPRRPAAQVKKADRAHLLHLLRLEEIQREIDRLEAQAASLRREAATLTGNPHPRAREFQLSYLHQAAQNDWLAEVSRNKLRAVEGMAP